MNAMTLSVLLVVAVLGLASCSEEPEPKDTNDDKKAVGQPGYAEQVGKQVDQAVLELQQRAKEAESRIGDKLIEVGKSIKQEEQHNAAGTE